MSNYQMDSTILSQQAIQKTKERGEFMLQPAFGAVLDITSNTDKYAASDYRTAFILKPLTLVLETILCVWMKETSDS